MSHYSVRSRCECQANLLATLDEHCYVVTGAASRGGTQETAPAHSIGAKRERFDIGWLCPFCGRNTLRTFDKGSLTVVAVPS